MEELPCRVAKHEAGSEDESDKLQGEGLKIMFSSSIIDIWTMLKIY